MRRLLPILMAGLLGLQCAGTAADTDVRALLQLIDYVGVDYPEAVRGGEVVNEGEYEEMAEFAGHILDGVTRLEPGPVRDALIDGAVQLDQGIADKVDPADIAALTQSLRRQLMNHFPLALTPRRAPDLRRAADLYQVQCASCHGAEGRGDGLAGAGLEPQPTDFHDADRARQRSLFGLYNTITLGVSGTGMTSFAHLSDADRWALAFYVGSLYGDTRQSEAGAAAWERAPLGLEAAVTLSPAELAAERTDGEALAVWLRSNAGLLFSAQPAPLDIAETALADSLREARAGNYEAAEKLAISAYLEGFELVEASLSNIDSRLMREVEQGLMAYRQSLSRGAGIGVIERQYEDALELLERSRTALDGGALSPSVAFVSALVILLREGLEAILVIAAMIAFLVKTGRPDALRYVHAGWLGALAAGLGTWGLSSYVITISGAAREVTEGFTALFAAGMLFYVGFWMHRNANAKRWNHYLQDKVQSALSRRAVWTLALVSFLAVYREVFETVLFYQALWAQSAAESYRAIWGGAAAAAVLLLVITWAVSRFGMRLPLKQFFSVSATLLIALALIFAGKGVAALQEAGTLAQSPVSGPTIELLGIYPNMQGLALQLVLLSLALALVWGQRRRDRA